MVAINQPTKPTRARPIEAVMQDIEQQLPQLADHIYMDREWAWYCGPSLAGQENKATREKLTAIGFRFSAKGHTMPDGETVGTWGHCGESPTPRFRKGRRPGGRQTDSQTDESSAPDWASLGL